MKAARPALRAGQLMAAGLRDTLRPPFSVLVALSLFVYVASASVSQKADESSLFFALLLAVVAAYAQIACTLAAADPEPGRSGDAWLIAAVRHRCLWRFALAELATVVLVALGLLALIVGAFVIGGVVALAQAAAVLERKWPFDALKRSAQVGREARWALTTIFGVLVLAPGALIQAGYQLGAQEALGTSWIVISLPGVVLTLAGTIALARAFVALSADRS
jgi:hypothetical protein